MPTYQRTFAEIIKKNRDDTYKKMREFHYPDFRECVKIAEMLCLKHNNLGQINPQLAADIEAAIMTQTLTIIERERQ